MKWFLIISAICLSSCSGYIEQSHQVNIEKYKNQCLESGLQENTKEFSQCVSISTFKARAEERNTLYDVSDKLLHQQNLQMLQAVSLK